jgi:hypothetical protein
VSVATQVLLLWGLDCDFFQSPHPLCPSHILPLDQRGQNSNFQHIILQDKYLINLLEELTSWDIVSVTFNFLETRLRATVRSLLRDAGRLASRLVGGSLIRGTLGSPGRLNLDRS